MLVHGKRVIRTKRGILTNFFFQVKKYGGQRTDVPRTFKDRK